MEQDYTIIISPRVYHEQFFLKNHQNKDLSFVKFYTWEEFKTQFYFDTNYQTINYLMNKYQLSVDLSKQYLNYLGYLNNETNNPKINEILNIKNDLIKQNLIKDNPVFRNKMTNEKILVYDYPKLDNYYINDLTNKINDITFINEQKEIENSYYVFNSIEAEISFIAEEIIKLLNNNISISNIYLTNLNDEYKVILKRIFKMYQIPLSINENSKLLSLPIAKELLSLLNSQSSNKEIYQLLKHKYEKDHHFNAIINLLNQYIDDNPLYSYISLIKNDLENTNIKPFNKYKSVKEVNDLFYLNQDDYLFVLGFNNDFPKYYKDDDYLLDEDKKLIGLDLTKTKNNKVNKSTLNKLKQKQVIITYAKNSYFSSYEISPLATYFTENKSSKTNYYHNDYYKYLLAKSLDNLINLNEPSKIINETYNNFKIPYQTYDNKFTGLNKEKLSNYLNNTLTLSYSTINEYFENPFIFYLKYILKIDTFESTFQMNLGTVFHDVLQDAFLESFNFEDSFAKSVSKFSFNAKEEFYINNLKQELIETIRIINDQNKRAKFNQFLYEERFVINYHLNNYDVTFKGFVDKVNIYEEQDQKYLTVVDYKTGNPDIDLRYLDYGLKMQLPVYAYLINHKYPNYKLLGIYLQKILHNKTSFNTKHVGKDLYSDYLKLEGYTINDYDLINIIDNEFLENSYIRGLKVSKTGFYKHAKVLSNNEFDEMIKKTESLIKSASLNITEGVFDIRQYVIDNKIYGYNYNKFKDICYFTPHDLKYISVKEEDN